MSLSEIEDRTPTVDESPGRYEFRVGFNISKVSSELTLFGKIWSRFHNAVVAGFQSAVVAGPLMQESLYGVAFLVEKIELSASARASCGVSNEDLRMFEIPDTTERLQSSSAYTNLFLGQLISDVSTAFRMVVLASPMRLVEPIYSCELQCDQNQLSNLYGVLSKRRGVIVNEDVIDGTSLFLLSATVPVTESFGFAQELLEKTSGNAISPQLTFLRWEVLDTDPFWRPATAQELEDFGNQATEPNIARNFIDKVRRRKGLPVEEKVVASAEKQRTLTKNK